MYYKMPGFTTGNWTYGWHSGHHGTFFLRRAVSAFCDRPVDILKANLVKFPTENSNFTTQAISSCCFGIRKKLL